MAGKSVKAKRATGAVNTGMKKAKPAPVLVEMDETEELTALATENDPECEPVADEAVTMAGEIAEAEIVEMEVAPRAPVPAPVPMPVPEEAAVEGYIDGLDARWNVVGWVRLVQMVSERLTVELTEAGRVVSSDIAMRFRGDLLDARRGDGKYGFQLAIPPGLFDGGRHGFVVRLAPPADRAVLGQLDIVLPSRLPKAAGVHKAAAQVTAADLVESVLAGAVAQPLEYMETYVQHLTQALDSLAQEYDFATALGMLYVHILRRRIDEGGLQTRLTRLSKNPGQLGDVVREIMYSDEAQTLIKTSSGYYLPDLEAVRAWTRLRPLK